MITQKISSMFLFLTISQFGIHNCQECTIEKTQSKGECKFIRDCDEVAQNYLKGIRDFTRCPGTPHKLNVCCPVKTTYKYLHQQKCHEYSEYAYTKEWRGIVNPTPVKIPKCGMLHEDMIIGGVNAKAFEFPHMALLGYNIKGKIDWKCGGTIISERFILTAAHCIKKNESPVVVRVGELNITDTSDKFQTEDISVEKIFKHELYKPKTMKNDIALIKLSHDIALNYTKKPACLPSSHNFVNDSAIASGWGISGTYDTRGSNYLQKVRLDIFNEKECDDLFKQIDNKKSISYNNQICAGSKTKEKDTCKGDSGGPLQICHLNEFCMYEVIGVTSFGAVDCGTKGIPGVYTRVFPYNDWIESIVWK